MIHSKIGIYKRGIKCENHSSDIFNKKTHEEQYRRGKVVGFSNKSKKRLSWVYNQYDWKSMITLTYHKDFPEDGKISKVHLNQLLKKIQKMKIKYLWVLEWQGRGFPHYHIWLDRELIRSEQIYIGESWVNITSQYNNTEQCLRLHQSESIYTSWKMEIGLNYAVKYAYKQEQKGLPVNIQSYGRWFGHTRFKIEPEIEIEYNDSEEDSTESVEMTRFKRQVHKCIRHWSKNKSKKIKKRSALKGFLYILSETRQAAINKLFEYHMASLINNQNLKES